MPGTSTELPKSPFNNGKRNRFSSTSSCSIKDVQKSQSICNNNNHSIISSSSITNCVSDHTTSSYDSMKGTTSSVNNAVNMSLASISNKFSDTLSSIDLRDRLIVLPATNQIRELHTILRNKETKRTDFVFYSDRLIRLVVEEGLNHLPYSKLTITTPTGHKYDGLRYVSGTCGVSIMRSGEAMEHGLRDCCRSIRIGKILIQSDDDTHEARVLYAKFPPEIHRRRILLMYPIMNTGNTVLCALQVLRDHGVQLKNVVILTLFITPTSAERVLSTFPEVSTILTSEIHSLSPSHFGESYFGTF